MDLALKEHSPVFRRMCADIRGPSIPPEHLLKACLLIAVYSIRSQRQFCDRLQYEFLLRWLLDLDTTDSVFYASILSKNKQRLLEHRVALEFLTAFIHEAHCQKVLSDEHFTVDGTLLQAWAYLKSILPRDKGGTLNRRHKNPDVDNRGEQRTNDANQSSSDPEVRLARKKRGKEARLCFVGHVLTENRTDLVTDVKVTRATWTAEQDTALDMREDPPKSRSITVGASKRCDTRDSVWSLPGHERHATCGAPAVVTRR